MPKELTKQVAGGTKNCFVGTCGQELHVAWALATTKTEDAGVAFAEPVPGLSGAEGCASESCAAGLAGSSSCAARSSCAAAPGSGRAGCSTTGALGRKVVAVGVLGNVFVERPVPPSSSRKRRR